MLFQRHIFNYQINIIRFIIFPIICVAQIPLIDQMSHVINRELIICQMLKNIISKIYLQIIIRNKFRPGLFTNCDVARSGILVTSRIIIVL